MSQGSNAASGATIMWKNLLTALSIFLMLAVGFWTGRWYEYKVDGAKSKSEAAYYRQQLQYATKAVELNPGIRIGIINGRLRELLKKHGVNAEKEGVYDK